MNALDRLVLQAEAMRRARALEGAPAAGGDGLEALLAPEGPVAELTDRLADHGRLLQRLAGQLGDGASARVESAHDGSVDQLIAAASRHIEDAQALLGEAAAADAALAERERQVLDELRHCDAVGLA